MQNVSVRACARCGAQMASGVGSCDACGTVGQVRHFDSYSAWEAHRADLAARGIDADGVVHHRYRWAIPAMSFMGSIFILAGFGLLLYTLRAGLDPSAIPPAVAAVVPLAWGSAFLAMAHRLRARRGRA